ncbi:HAMP domain-containing histidine kinase [Plectonema cf. radiosum LEGE 06105]|uniref:histidine kinase n=1 Tax=Plectonema cf. radiosum LEGE 06105 TaxID=945769 RepID=A0A8J7JVA7_9CYAN|nr:HAMP domain-containing sensor histidine kinase [Plectonema radiosum]MBE9215579.1 HAMP domain-containing histidine kinase [Plectonema cf. radiosum LEGE 06105]
MSRFNRFNTNAFKNYFQQESSAISKLPGYDTWRRLFWATRTRILFWYVIIITFIFIASVPAFRILLYSRVDRRVRRELVEKMEIFNQLLVNGDDISLDEAELDELEDSGFVKEPDERLTPPESQNELKDFFNAFLAKQLPEDDTFLLTFVDGKFFKSSPRGRPKIFDRDSQLMRDWAKTVKSEQGEIEETEINVGGIIYMAQPVKIQDEIIGVFVVAHTISGERQEVVEAVAVVIQVSFVVMFVASLLSWIASGKILAPIRSFSTTARSISESDLSKRIPVRGKDELAEVATTFNEMMDRLQTTFTTQRNFINDAGHELRTPITIIRGHLELMGEDDPKEINETVTLVLDELDRMSRFVEDLILLSKAERPDFLQLETVDINTLTQELFAKAQALGERNWCLDKIAQGKIVVDRQRITQAIMNLAQNATQYTISSDTIAIGSSLSKGKIKFWVRDTGEGIREADQQRIFERFARAAHSRRRSEGAGLGLSIVKAIVEAHNGEVRLESQLGKGANFCIILPVND